MARKKNQIDKFKEAARLIKAEQGERQFNRVLKRVAGAGRPAKAPSSKKRNKIESPQP